jgi:hypothetical protein
MIANRDLHLELEKIEKTIEAEKDEFNKAKLKALTLQIKLLSNLRTNMVTIMKHFKIPIKKMVETEEQK